MAMSKSVTLYTVSRRVSRSVRQPVRARGPGGGMFLVLVAGDTDQHLEGVLVRVGKKKGEGQRSSGSCTPRG